MIKNLYSLGKDGLTNRKNAKRPMKQPAAFPTSARATQGPYAFSIAAHVSTTNASTTRIITCRVEGLLMHAHQVVLPLIKQAAMTDDRGSQQEPWLTPNTAVKPRRASWKARLDASCRCLREKEHWDS